MITSGADIDAAVHNEYNRNTIDDITGIMESDECMFTASEPSHDDEHLSVKVIWRVLSWTLALKRGIDLNSALKTKQ